MENADLQVKRDFFDDPKIELGHVINTFITVREKLYYRVFVRGLYTSCHFLGQDWESHRDHEVVFDLQSSDCAVSAGDHSRRTAAIQHRSYFAKYRTLK